MLHVFLAAAILAQNPATYVVPDAVRCARCTITVTPIVKLGTADGPGSLPGRPDVHQATDGRYWVSPLDYDHPMLFGPDGRFIREFGKKGEGPNEVQRPWVECALPGDSMLIMDAPRGMTVVSPDLSLKRTIRTQNMMDVTPLRWPTAVIARQESYGRGFQDRTTQLAVYDFSGKTPRLITTLLNLKAGDRTRDQATSNRIWNESLRTIANPVAGHVWIAHNSRYALTRVGIDGRVQDSIVRSPSWFRGLQVMSMGTETVLPNPRLTAVREDAQGRLWVFLAKPRASALKEWRENKLRKGKGAVEGRVSDFPAEYKLFQTVIEVIDPKTRTLVATKTLDSYISSVLSTGRVASFVENEDGVPFATVWDVSLKEH
jgi:hypothetical protein